MPAARQRPSLRPHNGTRQPALTPWPPPDRAPTGRAPSTAAPGSYKAGASKGITFKGITSKAGSYKASGKAGADRAGDPGRVTSVTMAPPLPGRRRATLALPPDQAEPGKAGHVRKGDTVGPDPRKDGKLRPRLPPSNGPWRWRITRAAWTAADEQGFEEFIAGIGASDCATVNACLTSPTANPRFHNRHPPRMTFAADCADLPFVLRAYYAWQTGLPFSFPVRAAPHPRTGGHKSALLGRQTAERHDIVGPGPDPRLVFPAIGAFVSSEHFRAPPAYAGRLPNDHYPVRISRESIRPGTVIFDPDGHVAVVWRVTDDGRVLYLDAHPDNSLTRGTFNREFDRAEPPMGAGFKRWRPQRLVGARPAPDGTLAGGRVVLAGDGELADWSDEQFFGNATPRPADWSDGRFTLAGQQMEFHEYVRLRLAHPGFKYDPLAEVRGMLRQLCRDLQYRRDAVDLAIRAGIDRRPQPDRLPRNIYATSGDWEVYSTPSRDARIKTAFEELRDEIERFLGLAARGSGILDYAGRDLRQDLLDLYREEAAACSITYQRSDGSAVTLGFEEVKRRLFALSFDPHHCVERRWGASEAVELATCADDDGKVAWYRAQARLRNQLVRTYGEAMGWGLAELQRPDLDIGVEEAPDIDPMLPLLAIEAVAGSEGRRAELSIANGACPPGNSRRRNRVMRHCAN